MRALLLVWIGLLAVAPAATAQESVRPDTVRPDTLASARVDSTQAPTAERRARLAFPTDGGVFYYRAGSGTAMRRRAGESPEAPREALAPSSSLTPTPQPVTPSPVHPTPVAQAAPQIAPRQVAAPVRPAPDGVTQRDLDRLEYRLLDALDRRLSRLDRTPVAPPPQVIVVPGQPAPTPPPAVTPQAPAPGVPARSVDPTTPYAPPPVRTGGVTVEEIERDILDTGLFRTTAVNFEFAKAALLPVSETTLNALSDLLRRYPALRIEIGGHTDNVGTDATNDRLSVARAESVRTFLVAQGITPKRLTAIGYGERRPVASNDNETGRAINRRVDFVLLNPDAAQEIRRIQR